MPNGRAWTTGEVRRLRELRERGFKMKDIARLLGRTENAVFAFNRYQHVSRAPAKRAQPQLPSERLRIATLIAIAVFANDNGLDINAAANRLLMGRV